MCAIRNEIEQRVVQQVEAVRMAAEDSELRAMLAEDERTETLRHVEKAERKVKLMEDLLRKHGLNPMEAYGDTEK